MRRGNSLNKPRLGFLGVGWIGLNRMNAVIESGGAEIAALADPNPEAMERARSTAPCARVCGSLNDLLELDLDGVVIATPSALHATQSIAALRHGKAVFCQKPLGRNAGETSEIVAAARKADRLLGVDLSYRYLEGVRRMHERMRAGDIGTVFAANLVFHNAYGPDKPWYYHPGESGGGCVFDLGIHLVDLALWMLDFPEVTGCESRLFAGGKPIECSGERAEDFAIARLDLESGAVAGIECSWNLHAGRDAVIEASFYGDRGGLSVRNVNGSFYDFTAEMFRGTSRALLAAPPDNWGGRAILDWMGRLTEGGGFDPEIERLEPVATVLDALCGRTAAYRGELLAI